MELNMKSGFERNIAVQGLEEEDKSQSAKEWFDCPQRTRTKAQGSTEDYI